MSSQGPLNAATFANDAGIGSIAFSNTGNAGASDNAYAGAVLLIGQITQYLKATAFGFAIPGDATITGIVVEIEGSTTVPTSITDNSVKLVKGGTVSGSEKASAAQWPTTDAYQTYGSSTDLWGLTLTPADVNLSTFGVVISATAGVAATANIDHMRITIYWTGSNRSGNTRSYVRVGDGMSRSEMSS